MTSLTLTVEDCLQEDRSAATLVGRAWRPDTKPAGPSVIAVRGDRVVDISTTCATSAELMARTDAVAVVRDAKGEDIGALSDLLANSAHDSRNPSKPWLLAPIDLQAVKACGVTFAESMVERVIEEKAKGDPSAADAIRADIAREIGSDLSAIKPGG